MNNNTLLEFKVNNTILKRIESRKIVNKSKNIIRCKFKFKSSDWTGLNKFAIFKDSWGHSTTIHLGRKDGELSCIIPNNVIKGTFFKVSVYAGDLISTNSITVPLLQSGYDNRHKHDNHGCHESQDIFVEIFDKLDEKIDNLVFNDDCLYAYVDGELVDTICLPYVDEAHLDNRLDELIQEYVSKSELKSFLEAEGYIKNLDVDMENGLLIFEK